MTALLTVTGIITAVTSLFALQVAVRLKAVEIAEEQHRAVVESLLG